MGLDLSDPADIEDARGLLAAIDGVEKVTVSDRPSQPWNLTVASAGDEGQVRSDVLAIVAREGLPLTSIRSGRARRSRTSIGARSRNPAVRPPTHAAPRPEIDHDRERHARPGRQPGRR